MSNKNMLKFAGFIDIHLMNELVSFKWYIVNEDTAC